MSVERINYTQPTIQGCCVAKGQRKNPCMVIAVTEPDAAATLFLL
jgi:hypothetical protein